MQFLPPESLPRLPQAPVLTIGTFDGVHLGHRAILGEVIRQAGAEGRPSLVVTFDPHPRSVLFPDSELRILTPLAEKLRLLEEAGIEQVVVVPFTREFAALSAEAYVRDFLVSTFHPQTIVIGYDHHFGSGRKGNLETLRKFSATEGFEVREIPARLIDAAAVSSTKIRRALEGGEVESAAQMLERPYSLGGLVEAGDRLGRTIGYPTANLRPEDPQQLVPANGVYAVRAALQDGSSHPAMLNIGVRPTVTDLPALRIEAHLIGFDGDLYGRPLRLEFIARIREEQKFASLDALKAQLALDREAALRLL